MIILGIDPGTAITGYGILKKERRNNLVCVTYGCIFTDSSLTAGDRLKKIEHQVNALIRMYRPVALAVESLFFFKNLKTAVPVSQTKGVILLAAAKRKIPVFEYTPPQVKMAVTGYGRADKSQMQKMVREILNLKDLPKPDDAADALAVAMCYAHSVDSRVR